MVWQHSLYDDAITIWSDLMTELSVAVVQQSCDGAYEENLAQSILGIREAAAQGAQLILLSELHTRPYFCQVEQAGLFDLAEMIPGPTTERLGRIAAELNVVIICSIFEKRATGLYHNTAVVLEKDGQIAGKYRKMHIPDDPNYYEKFYFSPGDLGFTPINTSLGRLGVLVCWDQWYPEAARLMALAGAELLVYPTAIGWGTSESDEQEKERQRTAWMLIQRSHAIANAVPVLVANRVGFEAERPEAEAGLQFWGSSFIAGQQGELIAEASRDKIELLVAQVDLARNESVRRGWPFLRDRRTDAYQGLLQRYLD